MIMHPVIRRIARKWAGSSESFPAAIQAMYLAEGGTDAAFIRAVKCSEETVETLEQAVEIACRSHAHRLSDFVVEHQAPEYTAYLGSFWAPEGARNDPKNLNSNWPRNMLALWLAQK